MILSTMLFFLSSLTSKAQQKYEREYRMDAEMIPSSAKIFVDSIGPNSRIRWYKEIGLNDVSIEAKFKHDEKKYSVEFDTLGALQDVEFIIKKREIALGAYRKIERHLDSLYQKWKFKKIQLHYRGRSSDILTSISKNKPSSTIDVFYEIVVRGKALGNVHLYEIQFNHQGELVYIKQIVQDNADHLEY